MSKKMGENITIIIHSKVSIGYVGSNTTSLVLQMGGYEAAAVPTVLYSNHLGRSTVGGGIVSAELFSSILKGILELGMQRSISTIITGYIGSAEQVKIIADFIKTIRRKNPGMRYLCDPVMGDTDKGQYVAEDVPDAIITHLVPLADLLTPNQFEAERIMNKEIHNTEEIARLLPASFNLEKQKIVITGGNFDTFSTNFIYSYIADNSGSYIAKAQKIDLNPPGTGELFTAHLHLSMQRGIPFQKAVTLSGNIVSLVLRKMRFEGRTEFELQDILFSMSDTLMVP